MNKQVERLLITCSNQGMVYLSRGKKPFYQPSFCCRAIDVIGAGDVVSAMLAVGYICDLSDIESIVLANKCAGVCVENKGTSIINLPDIKRIFPNSNKLIKDKLLLKILRKNYQNKKIVFTNGCFDLIHIGHLDLLRQAREMGDVLIVGLNTDSSIKSIKGEKRPIFDENYRTRFLH